MPPEVDPWTHGPQKFPSEIVPLSLYALAKCWHGHMKFNRANDAVKRTVDLISQEKTLWFLRQNLYQECARYYWESELFDLADDMLERQLSIVRSKGSRILINHVLTNWLINKGNLHCLRGEYTDANRHFKEALALVESAWEPNQQQVEWLHLSLRKLDGHIPKQT
jgi:tetratricopeptide (TPR) repeat protein